MSERETVLRLKVAADPRNGQAFNELAAGATKADSRTKALGVTGMKSMVDIDRETQRARKELDRYTSSADRAMKAEAARDRAMRSGGMSFGRMGGAAGRMESMMTGGPGMIGAAAAGAYMGGRINEGAAGIVNAYLDVVQREAKSHDMVGEILKSLPFGIGSLSKSFERLRDHTNGTADKLDAWQKELLSRGSKSELEAVRTSAGFRTSDAQHGLASEVRSARMEAELRKGFPGRPDEWYSGSVMNQIGGEALHGMRQRRAGLQKELGGVTSFNEMVQGHFNRGGKDDAEGHLGGQLQLGYEKELRIRNQIRETLRQEEEIVRRLAKSHADVAKAGASDQQRMIEGRISKAEADLSRDRGLDMEGGAGFGMMDSSQREMAIEAARRAKTLGIEHVGPEGLSLLQRFDPHFVRDLALKNKPAQEDFDRFSGMTGLKERIEKSKEELGAAITVQEQLQITLKIDEAKRNEAIMRELGPLIKAVGAFDVEIETIKRSIQGLTQGQRITRVQGG